VTSARSVRGGRRPARTGRGVRGPKSRRTTSSRRHSGRAAAESTPSGSEERFLTVARASVVPRGCRPGEGGPIDRLGRSRVSAPVARAASFRSCAPVGRAPGADRTPGEVMHPSRIEPAPRAGSANGIRADPCAASPGVRQTRAGVRRCPGTLDRHAAPACQLAGASRLRAASPAGRRGPGSDRTAHVPDDASRSAPPRPGAARGARRRTRSRRSPSGGAARSRPPGAP
jgi:hypothetical protein